VAKKGKDPPENKTISRQVKKLLVCRGRVKLGESVGEASVQGRFKIKKGGVSALGSGLDFLGKVAVSS